MHEEQILIDHARNYMQAVNAVHRKYIPLYREGKRDLFGSYRQELELVREHYLVPKNGIGREVSSIRPPIPRRRPRIRFSRRSWCRRNGGW